MLSIAILNDKSHNYLFLILHLKNTQKICKTIDYMHIDCHTSQYLFSALYNHKNNVKADNQTLHMNMRNNWYVCNEKGRYRVHSY